VRAPALHFLVLGALLFALGTRPSGSAARPPVVFTTARVTEIRDDYRRTMRAAPTPAELDALIAREADEEMLYREALLLGLDRGDRAVEWRVLEKMRFLYGDAAGDTAEALRRGLALGLERDDVVVRNTLVTKMRLLAKAASRSEEPGGRALERELDAYFQRHRDAYAQPERLTLTQVFLSAAKRGAALEDDARAVLRQLEASRAPAEAGTRLGDAFVSGSVFRSIPRSALARTFGDGFAAAVSALEPERWSGPIRSPYGLHLVWVAGREAAGVPALDAVRPRVLGAYRAERQARYLERMLQDLRAAYEVRIEHGS
jgi:hypothetical protein